MKNLIQVKSKVKIYIHKEIKIGWFRFCFYSLGKKLTIRFEISKGWDK